MRVGGHYLHSQTQKNHRLVVFLYFAAFTVVLILDFFRAAVFGLITPRLAALSIAL